MSEKISILGGFSAVEHISEQFETDPSLRIDINSHDLELGPLAEVLVLRPCWHSRGGNVRIQGRGHPRHDLFSDLLPSNKPTSKFGPNLGALRIVGYDASAEEENHRFVGTTGRLAMEAGMPVKASKVLKGVLGELVGNVGDHGGVGVMGFASFELSPNSIYIAVADTGRGIVGGYRETLPELTTLTAADALEWAVKLNKSRFTDTGRGLGFARVLAACRSMDAALRVRSDDASIEIEGVADSAAWRLSDQSNLPGFVVSLHLRW